MSRLRVSGVLHVEDEDSSATAIGADYGVSERENTKAGNWFCGLASRKGRGVSFSLLDRQAFPMALFANHSRPVRRGALAYSPEVEQTTGSGGQVAALSQTIGPSVYSCRDDAVKRTAEAERFTGTLQACTGFVGCIHMLPSG